MRERRLIERGKNSAGYPEFTRGKSKGIDSQPPAKQEISRRGFLKFLGKGAVGVALVSQVPKMLNEGGDQDNASLDYDSERLGRIIDGDAPSERSVEQPANTEQPVHSVHFNAEVDTYAAYYERDMAFVQEYGNKITTNDPEGRTRIQYVSEMLQVGAISETMLAELRAHCDGLCFVESRFDAARVSRDGARGVMQIVPATWEEHGDVGANPLSLVEQIEAAGRLMTQAYRHLTNRCDDEFNVIRSEFFNGNEEDFEKFFLVPVLINAYNAGAGTMEGVVKWFVRTYGTEELLTGAFGSQEKVAGYDVYLALSQKGAAEGANRLYKEEASTYTLKVYGADECLRRYFENGRRA